MINRETVVRYGGKEGRKEEIKKGKRQEGNGEKERRKEEVEVSKRGKKTAKREKKKKHLYICFG